jgi:predicted naringenin-chalcone synthase
MNPCIVSLGTALPAHRFSQEELRLAYHDIAEHQLAPRSVRLMDRVFASGNGIESRALACAEPRAVAEEGPDELHERFRAHAVKLGTEALSVALRRASLAPDQIRTLVACTCTGYLCPGLTSYIAENLALREDLQVFDLVGMGCGASVPALNLALQVARQGPDRPVAVVSSEVCSATAYFDDDPELIVSNCIFADGAGAAIVAGSDPGHSPASTSPLPSSSAPPRATNAADWANPAGRNGHRPGLELIDFESSLWPEYRDRLRFRQSGGKLRNCLSRDVPDLAAEMAHRTLQRLLSRHGLQLSDIRRWAIHPGGKRVLERFAERVCLSESDLRDSYRVLSTCGNMSSPSVLFVLESLWSDGEWKSGDWGICSAFGAGLTCHMGLFRTATLGS